MKKAFLFLVLVLFVQISQAGNQPGTFICQPGKKNFTGGYISSYSVTDITVKICGVELNGKIKEFDFVAFNSQNTAGFNKALTTCSQIAPNWVVRKTPSGDYYGINTKSGEVMEAHDSHEGAMEEVASFIKKQINQ